MDLKQELAQLAERAGIDICDVRDLYRG